MVCVCCCIVVWFMVYEFACDLLVCVCIVCGGVALCVLFVCLCLLRVIDVLLWCGCVGLWFVFCLCALFRVCVFFVA